MSALSDPSAKIETIEIPGEPTLHRTYEIPPVQIRLPLIARVRPGLSMLATGAGGLVCLAISYGYLNDISYNSLSRTIFSYTLGGVFLITSLLSLGMFLTKIIDTSEGGEGLIVDGRGFCDYRLLQSPVSWDEVEAISFYSMKHAQFAVVRTRGPVAMRRNIFRPGGLIWWRPANEIHVLITELDQSARTVAEVMKALVRLSGGKVEDFYN